MSANDLELLGQYVREQSQDAFTELVKRHVNLVYSAALRQVRSPHQAEEVAQTVFTSLAGNAAKLSSGTILSAWLYRVTRHAAIDLIRSEARRQAREQLSVEMSALNDNSAGWEQIEPMLDDAMEALDEVDRASILLRYFENKSLREVGETLGVSEDAAQKRVSRALERLRETLSERKVAVAGTALAVLLAANAVQAAPSALAATLALAAGAMPVASTAAVTTTATLTKTATIAMTITQKIIVSLALAGAIAAGLYEAHQASDLRQRVQTLQDQQDQQAAKLKEFDSMKSDRDRSSNALAQIKAENDSLKNRPSDVLKLRSQVGKLKQENAAMGSTSALSKMTANPETRKMMRDQQKLGMSIIYKEFANQAKLTPDQTSKLNDLLADHIMTNVDHVTAFLKDKTGMDEMNQTLASEEKGLEQQLGELLGQDGLAAYQQYDKNLASILTGTQFKDQLSGTDEEKASKSTQLTQLMENVAASQLAAANLPANTQVVPILNFVNIASEQAGNQSLGLLSNIYQNVAEQAASFLSADDLASFKKFAALALSNNTNALRMNRTLMAPIGQ